MSIAQRQKDVLKILKGINFPIGPGTEFSTTLRQKRVANILMGVANLRWNQPFSEIVYYGDGNQYAPRTRDLIRFINQNYGEKIADSSYDDIRRKNLDFLVEAGIVVRAANRPGAATNDGTRGYAVSPDAKDLFLTFNTKAWSPAVANWKKKVGNFSEKLARPRSQKLVDITLPDGKLLNLSEGKHNDLQKAIIEDFLPRFLLRPELLYFGDTAKKALIHNADHLYDLGLREFRHETLPDIVAIDREKEWVYFIEAVHSANPISRIRHLTLERLSANCPFGKVYVSAFLDRTAFRQWVPELSWETEVWLASDPSHMIHFNGDRFLGPHET
jgi:type II restriction enzyme